MDAIEFVFPQSGFEGASVSDAAFLQVIFSMIWLIGLVALFGLAQQVLFGLAAYNDARAKGNPDAVMWGLLVGFLGLIPGIIYLFVRNSNHSYVVCQSCGFTHMASDFSCPKCGAPGAAPNQYANPLVAEQAHRARVLLIIAIILFVISIILSLIFAFSIASAAVGYAGNAYYY